MSQTTSFIPQPLPQHLQGNIRFQQPGSNNAFVVVDQQPSRREVFPYSLHVNGILAFSILKCIIGSLLFLAGIVNVAVVQYDTKIPFGIWCGLTILANGIIGCVLKFKQNKCLIGGFFGLSITSLIFDVSMLSFYSIVLFYFVNFSRIYCFDAYNYQYYCALSSDARSLGTGMASFSIFLAVCELACSIGSVALSSKAYCKFCTSCDVDDCGTCLGCCECSITPLNIEQDRQPLAPHSVVQDMQRPPVQLSTHEHNPNQPHSNIPVRAAAYNQPHSNTPVQAPAQNMQGSQANPCSGLMNFVINMPAYLFGGTNGTQLSALNVSIQAVPLNQQNPVTDPDRNARPVHVMTTVGTEQNPTPPTWQQYNTCPPP